MMNIMHIILVLFFLCTIEATLDDFIKKYQCNLDQKNLKCSDTSQKILDLSLIDKKLDHLDVSNCQIEKIKFPEKPLSLFALNLSNNVLSELTEKHFASLPHLKELDLSANKLEKVHKAAFKGISLEHLNLSSTGYQFSHELCELELLKTLDVSFLDLIKLECLNSINLTSLFAKKSQNFESSYQNWLPNLSGLKFIDLSSSDIVNLDSKHFKNLSLTHFIFANNPQINSTNLELFFSNSSILSSLKCLVLKQSGLDSDKFPLGKIIAKHNSILDLEMLDLSNNSYSDDLNEFLFNQKNLANLKYFMASGNKFEVCNMKLMEKGVKKLMHLDISGNRLNGSSCLFSVRYLKSLTYLDMSHNYLNGNLNEIELSDIFFELKNLTNINLSYNYLEKFVVRFSPNHTRIKSIDFSHNYLTRFRFEPFDSKTDSNLEDKFYEKEDEQFDVVVESPVKVESDERYIFVDTINLSHNKFEVVNIHHQFQSIENIMYLNFSHNPIIFANGLSDEAVLFANMSIQSDQMRKILCIDRLDFGSNFMKKIPNMMHSCISKVNLENNQLDRGQRLIVSNFTIYFLDELNLKNNNIESISVGLSGQKYMSDFYPSKNSPVDYFYGKVNKTLANHTILDIRGNQDFKCDCRFFKTIHEYVYFNFLVDCRLRAEVIKNCTFIVSQPDATKTKQLNSKLRFSFVLTCLFLIAISFTLIVFMCSDMCKNFTYFDQIRAISRQKFDQFRTERQSESIDVQYSKLIDEATVSTIEMNS